jgi:hypothetical protein
VADQIVLHTRGRCVGVVRNGVLYTHNGVWSWPRPNWDEVTEDELPPRLRGGAPMSGTTGSSYLAAARRNAARGGARG